MVAVLVPTAAWSSAKRPPVLFDLGKKAWDNPGYEDTQPSSVTIHLKERDTGDIVSTAELTGENGWQYTFTDLPLSPDHYTVTEQPLEGYKATYYQDADGNFIITNTHLTTPTPMPDVPAVTISVPVEKKWVNDYKWERPASIHVSLWNGDAKVKSRPDCRYGLDVYF